MNVNQLNDTVVLVAIDGKGVLVDPGEKMAPFQTLNWRHSERAVCARVGKDLGTRPRRLNRTQSTQPCAPPTIFLDGHGGVTGTIRVVMSGQAAFALAAAALRNDEKELRNSSMRNWKALVPDGVEAHVDHFLGIGRS